MLELLFFKVKRNRKKKARNTPSKLPDEKIDDDAKRDKARAKLESQRLKLNQSLLKSNSHHQQIVLGGAIKSSTNEDSRSVGLM